MYFPVISEGLWPNYINLDPLPVQHKVELGRVLYTLRYVTVTLRYPRQKLLHPGPACKLEDRSLSAAGI